MRVQIIASQLNSTADDIAFSVPPHWHDTHDEIHHVIKGRMEVTLGSETKIYTPEDGEIFIPRGVVHSIRAFKEDAIIEERTQPMVRTSSNYNVSLNRAHTRDLAQLVKYRMERRRFSSGTSSRMGRRHLCKRCSLRISWTCTPGFPVTSNGWRKGYVFYFPATIVLQNSDR